MQNVRFFTLGCKVNQYETQALRELFLNAGFREEESGPADFYVVNTCTVTDEADKQAIRLVKKLLQHNPPAKVVVTGCLAETNSIERLSPKLYVIPNAYKHEMVELLSSMPPGFRLEKRTADRFLPLGIARFAGHERAFVKVQDGCDNFCSYCRVPWARGRSFSRNPREVLREVVRLTDGGFKEIVLTGICLGDYRWEGLELADLIVSLRQIKKEFRIRLSSIEPQLMSGKLIDVFSASLVCPHLHIPLQSGDDQILNRMNRRYTQKKYLCLIEKIKKKVKDAAVTTDVLVGFPGEEEGNFHNTVICLKKMIPLRVHIFPFSIRPGTVAANFSGRPGQEAVKKRIELLKALTDELSYGFRKKFLGRELRVLVEGPPEKKTKWFSGYSDNYIRVAVENAALEDINNLLPVKITAVDADASRGIISKR